MHAVGTLLRLDLVEQSQGHGEEGSVKLLVEIGLLTEVRGVADRWLLPLRLLLKVLYPLYQL